MLFGGRELPERPLWVRLLTVAAVLSMAAPLIRFSVGTLQDQFLKMNLEDTQAVLASHPFTSAVGPDRDPSSASRNPDVRCEPGSDGWDYFCSYTKSGHRLRVGVRVGHRSIQQVRYVQANPSRATR
jgi:hypothetical protein